MDKILAAILEVNMCDDLFKILEKFMYEVELSSLLISRDSFNDILRIIFKEYAQDVEIEEKINRISIPNYVYLTLAITSIALSDTYIHRFALRFSKIFKAKILKTLSDEGLLRLCQKLGIRLEYSENKCFKEIQSSITKNDTILTICYKYRLPIIDYLRISRKLLMEYPWKLSSLVLDKGYVYIDSKERILRLISEQLYNIISTKLRNIKNSCIDQNSVKNKLLNTLRGFNPELAEVIDKFTLSIPQPKTISKDFLESITGTLNAKALKEAPKMSTVDELIALAQKLFPPCIRGLVEALVQGENLSHHQRFAIATFLINLGVDPGLILELFSRSPDFDEKVTRYQIEHLAGLRGSRKKYLVYSCNTMKTLGMCKAECGIKNPLLYLRKIMSSVKRN